jgi:hypothetical protein
LLYENINKVSNVVDLPRLPFCMVFALFKRKQKGFDAHSAQCRIIYGEGFLDPARIQKMLIF